MFADEFSTLPVKPDLAPEEVGGGGGKVGDLQITWKPLEPWEENGPRFGYRVFWKPTGEEEFDDDQACYTYLLFRHDNSITLYNNVYVFHIDIECDRKPNQFMLFK